MLKVIILGFLCASEFFPVSFLVRIGSAVDRIQNVLRLLIANASIGKPIVVTLFCRSYESGETSQARLEVA